MKTWLVYGGVSVLLVVLGGVLAGYLDPSSRVAIWVGLSLAWVVQLAAFAVFLGVVRWRPRLIVAGWTAGTFMRLLALAAIAWLSVKQVWSLPADVTLVAAVAGLFVLLLLEPIVYRYHLRA